MFDIKLEGPGSNVKTKGQMLSKEAKLNKDMKREAILKKAIKSETGLKKIAAALSR